MTTGWWHVQDAPLGVTGQVWSVEMEADEACLGVVRRGPGGDHFIASSGRGYTFTHWHPLARPPVAEVTLEAALDLATRRMIWPDGDLGDRLERVILPALENSRWTAKEWDEAMNLKRFR